MRFFVFFDLNWLNWIGISYDLKVIGVLYGYNILRLFRCLSVCDVVCDLVCDVVSIIDLK